MNKIDMTSSLWFYVIHSQIGELFHKLETNKVPTSDDNNADNDNVDYTNCLKESIKCHHNDIAKYIENNLLVEKQIDEEIVSIFLKYHNYSYFNSTVLCQCGFFDLYLNNYNKLVNILLEIKGKEIEEKIILNNFFFSNEKLIQSFQ